MLGIIIGISSVIMIISIGNGVTDQVNGELNDMAGGQIYIYANNDKADDLIEFTNEDFDAIEEKHKLEKRTLEAGDNFPEDITSFFISSELGTLMGFRTIFCVASIDFK